MQASCLCTGGTLTLGPSQTNNLRSSLQHPLPHPFATHPSHEETWAHPPLPPALPCCVLPPSSNCVLSRVDKGFVAQVADVIGGRQVKLNKAQQVEAEKKVPLEVKPDVKHTEGPARI